MIVLTLYQSLQMYAVIIMTPFTWLFGEGISAIRC